MRERRSPVPARADARHHRAAFRLGENVRHETGEPPRHRATKFSPFVFSWLKISHHQHPRRFVERGDVLRRHARKPGGLHRN